MILTKWALYKDPADDVLPYLIIAHEGKKRPYYKWGEAIETFEIIPLSNCAKHFVDGHDMSGVLSKVNLLSKGVDRAKVLREAKMLELLDL